MAPFLLFVDGLVAVVADQIAAAGPAHAAGLRLPLGVEHRPHPHRVLRVRLREVQDGELVLQVGAHVLHAEVEPLWMPQTQLRKFIELFCKTKTTEKENIRADIKGRVMGRKIDSWSWVGTKFGIESAISLKIIIFKDGTDFSFTRRPLQYLLNT